MHCQKCDRSLSIFLRKKSWLTNLKLNYILFFPDINLTVSEDKVNQFANNATNKLNTSLLELRRLFLVENMLDSVKFGLSLWVLTYIGSWFNAMTLILLSWVGLFSVPKVNSYFLSREMCFQNSLAKFFQKWNELKTLKGLFIKDVIPPSSSLS